MKYAIIWLLIAATIMLGLPASALSDFKKDTQSQVAREVGAFFSRNQGNKLSIDMITGLILQLNQVFQKNVIPDELDKEIDTEKGAL